MVRTAKATFLLAALAMAIPWASAQEKPKSEDAATEARQTETTQLKVSFVLTEFDGEKKVKSLPYTMVVIADEKPPKSAVKVGSRIPVYVGKEYGMQYLDIGTNIDCQASRANDNRFEIKLILERSWVEGNVEVTVDPGASQQIHRSQFPEPIVRQFKSELSLLLRDGQTLESSFATDPLSGKVFKMEVSLKVLQ
jgi:hypothetical protein